jgi:hypothetical protein
MELTMIDGSNQPIVKPEIEKQEVEVEEVATAVQEMNDSFAVQDNAQMPICTVDFKNANIESLNADVQVGPGTFYNSHYGNSWIMHFPGNSFFKLSVNIEKRNADKKYMLDLFHLSSIVSGHLMDAPISIYVNGKAVITGHNPNNCGYVHQQFEVTQFLVDGANRIEIRFDDGAQTNYWIQSLAILEI